MTSLIEGCPLLTLFSARRCRSITHATLYLLGTPSAPSPSSCAPSSSQRWLTLQWIDQVAAAVICRLWSWRAAPRSPSRGSSTSLACLSGCRFSMRPRWATTTPPSVITTSNPTGAYHRSAAVVCSCFVFSLLASSGRLSNQWLNSVNFDRCKGVTNGFLRGTTQPPTLLQNTCVSAVDRRLAVVRTELFGPLPGQVCPNLASVSLRDCPLVLNGVIEEVMWWCHSRQRTARHAC